MEVTLPPRAIPYVLLQGFLFGSTLIASRFSVGQFHPLLYIGLRLVISSVGYAAVYLIGRRSWPRERRLWTHGAVLGVLGTAAPVTFIVSSLQYQSSGVTSTLITLGPAITVVLAHFALKDEDLNRRKVLGVALALSGGVLLALRGETGLPDVGQANPVGYVLVLLAVLSASSATIFARKYMKDMDEFDVASVRIFSAAVVVLPFTLLIAGLDFSGVDVRGYFALGYASLIGTFLGMMVAFVVVNRFGATASAMTVYVIPAVAGVGGVLLLDEQITLGLVLGMVLIAGGILLINREPPRMDL
jgi:drug/metabolite transporter (DMT)-like permease